MNNPAQRKTGMVVAAVIIAAAVILWTITLMISLLTHWILGVMLL